LKVSIILEFQFFNFVRHCLFKSTMFIFFQLVDVCPVACSITPNGLNMVRLAFQHSNLLIYYYVY